MDRKLKTVAQVWEEFDEGRNGKPSVRLMKRHHRAKWRKESADRKYFSNRKAVYTAIRRLSPPNCALCTESEVYACGPCGKIIAEALDGQRRRKDMTLAAYQTALTKGIVGQLTIEFV